MADRRYFQMIGTPNSKFLKSLLESPVDLAETARDKIEALGGELLGYYMSISEPKLYGVLVLPDSDTVAAIAYQRIAAGAMEDVKFMDIDLMNAVCGLGWTGIERMDQTRLVTKAPWQSSSSASTSKPCWPPRPTASSVAGSARAVPRTRKWTMSPALVASA